MRVDSGVITGEWIGWFGVQDLFLQSLAGIDELGGCDFDSRDPCCGWECVMCVRVKRFKWY